MACRQPIIRSNAGILLIRPLATNFSKIWIEINKCYPRNVFENVCKMASISPRPQWVKWRLVIGDADAASKRPISLNPQNELVLYHKIHHIGRELYTCLLQREALWDMGPVYGGICEVGLFLSQPIADYGKYCYHPKNKIPRKLWIY